jgi:hypothetical protein
VRVVCLASHCVIWLCCYIVSTVYHLRAASLQGLVFFNWSDKQHNKSFSEYVWSGSDWPLDGWAGCQSTPTPTSISPGVDLGRKKGSQLGSVGATTGLSSLAKPGRDLTGGGAFGIPGYAGIGASGFGWGEPEEFEDFIDPPATLENIHSRALSRHPSLPLFLVGSSNTHVYLWEVYILYLVLCLDYSGFSKALLSP